MLQAGNNRLGILRLDRLHPEVSGNKWFKLRENIKAARAAGCSRLLTFGGAYSNHLAATAAAAHALGMSSIGLVRGLHAAAKPTPTLEACRAWGMQLCFLSREEYAARTDARFLEDLQERFPGAFLIPEGGNNAYGLEGAAAIAGYIPPDADLVCLAIGTGTTFAGLRNGLPRHIAMRGFPVMKGGAYLQDVLEDKIHRPSGSWQLDANFHFGGFARHTPELIGFMNEFFRRHRVPLDFVYTAKMMYGVLARIREKEIKENTHIVCIHTGGLQGNRSVSSLLSFN